MENKKLNEVIQTIKEIKPEVIWKDKQKSVDFQRLL